MGANPYRPDPGSPTTVRDRKRLVQVEVRNVRTERTRLRQAHQRVQVGAVDVHLPTGLVHSRTDLPHRFFEYAVGRWIRDHQRGQILPMLVDLRLQIGQVYISGLVARHDNNMHTRHHGARCIGAVGAARNQAHRPLRVTIGLVIRPNGHEARELPLRSSVRLHGDRVVSRDPSEPSFELGDHLHIRAHLLGRRERVRIGEFRPGDRRHLRCGIELHRARPQRDHRPVESKILIGQRTHVAHQRRLRTVAMEDRIREKFFLAAQLAQAVAVRHIGEIEPPLRGECLGLILCCCFVDGHAHSVCVDDSYVNASGPRLVGEFLRRARDLQRDRVEDQSFVRRQASVTSPGSDPLGQVVHSPRDTAQPIGTVVDRVHAGQHRKQDLRSADIAGGLLTPDVLLACL